MFVNLPGDKGTYYKYGVYIDLDDINKMVETIYRLHTYRKEIDNLNAIVYDITFIYFEDT